MTATLADRGGLTVEASVALAASLDGLSAEMRRRRDYARELLQNIQYIGLIPWGQITTSGSSGALNQPTVMGPRTGWAWDVHRITAAGHTGGTVSVYIDAVADGNQVAVFSAAGVLTFGKGQILVESGHWLIAQAASLTGNATLSCAVTHIAQGYVSDYLL